MNTKLTLRMDGALVDTAKSEARQRGKSVSQMVEDFFGTLSDKRRGAHKLPPITASLAGLLKGKKVSEASYKTHLREKYL